MPFWTDYHQQQGHHLSSHLGSSSELLHRLAEDVKLSAHGKHPTVYPFLFVVLVFTFIFILFSCITFVFSFQRQKKKKGISVQVWGCAMSHANPDSSLTPSPGQLFPCNYTLGTMCNLSLGVWEHNFTHLVSLKEKKKLHVHVVLNFG
jgi:hypothetical protein